MYLPKRRVENIRQFRALFQDIDCESMGLEKAETVYMIWMLYYEGKIPKPTMVTGKMEKITEEAMVYSHSL